MMRPKTTKNIELPPRMLKRTRRLKSGKVWFSYYYNGYENGKRKEIPLGSDLELAKRKWAELENIILTSDAQPSEATFAMVAERWINEYLPHKKLSTQKGTVSRLKRYIIPVFGHMALDQIRTMHIAQYRDARYPAKSINVEISNISSIFNFARECGYTDRENPVRGIKRAKIEPRDYLVEKDVWYAVYNLADNTTKNAMDLAYITGQRISDVLNFKFSDIKNGALEVKQQKTNKKLRILIEEDGVATDLGLLIDRIKNEKKNVIPMYLVANKKGQRIKYITMYRLFEKFKKKAIEKNPELAERIKEFQFRDIRALTASSTENLEKAQKLLGHTKSQITKSVYRRVGETVSPLKKMG